MLLEQEVSILCKDSRGRTPLHYAAAHGHATWLSELLQMALSDEDCSFKDNQGYTPLHWACYNGKLLSFYTFAKLKCAFSVRKHNSKIVSSIKRLRCRF